MRTSSERILSTHTGSLPRPASLVDLYARRARGEAVDEAQLAAEGHTAMLRSVERQIEAGLDVINNGEQQREGFFL
ncbi:MAG: methionine synthase, partial [Betaproteobacteria bacterium]|nr:methionine synthase [Betaproteobacteria bacterium]